MARRPPKGVYARCGDPDRPGGKPGAVNRAGQPCRKPRGWGTDHVGVGRCKNHGGATPIASGRYSKIARRRLKAELEQLAKDDDPLDLLPDLELIRAIAMKELKTTGPSQVVVEMLEKATKVVDMIQKHKREGVVTLQTVSRIMEQMGASVARVIKDPELLAAIEHEWSGIRLS